MWQDNDSKIMNILNKIETKSKEQFPVTCPICGEKEGHMYFHRNNTSENMGGMWTWCSSCRHSAHALFRIPKWWINLKEIDFEKLTSYPDYLEENKVCIDEWINELLF